MEDLVTIFTQQLDHSSGKFKETRHMNDFRNLFLYSQDQRQHHVYHKRAQGRQHSKVVREVRAALLYQNIVQRW